MSLHWRMLSTAEKIEAVKTAWHPGISASRIAAHFYGATRNAVIGLYSRYPSDLSGTPLKKPTKAVVAMVEAKTKRNYTVRIPSTLRPHFDEPTPIQEPAIEEMDWHVCGKPLAMLGSGQCKFPVNDAAVGEMHLFCSMAADRSFCNVHMQRAYRSRT